MRCWEAILWETQPTRGVFSLDNSRLYISNFGGNNVAVYDIDLGKVVAYLPVGSHPDALALSQNQDYLLVVDSGSGPGGNPETQAEKKFEPSEYSLLTIIPVGMQPNQIVVKSFLATGLRVGVRGNSDSVRTKSVNHRGHRGHRGAQRSQGT